jgi:hypothetical protein
MWAMRRGALWISFLLMLVPLTAPGADDKKDAPPKDAAKKNFENKEADKKEAPKKDAEKPDTEKLVPAGQVTGVLKTVGGSEKYLSLETTVRYLEPNPQAQVHLVQQQQQLALRQMQIMQNPNPFVRNQQMIQLLQQAQLMQLQAQNAVLQVKEAKREIELQPINDVVIRRMQLPLAFDDKGFPKKYTAQELKELKGTGNLPGYNADRIDLQAGQTVMVYLVKQQKDPPKPAAKEKEAENPKEARAPAPSTKALVRLIVILAEPRK